MFTRTKITKESLHVTSQNVTYSVSMQFNWSKFDCLVRQRREQVDTSNKIFFVVCTMFMYISLEFTATCKRKKKKHKDYPSCFKDKGLCLAMPYGLIYLMHRSFIKSWPFHPGFQFPLSHPPAVSFFHSKPKGSSSIISIVIKPINVSVYFQQQHFLILRITLFFF